MLTSISWRLRNKSLDPAAGPLSSLGTGVSLRPLSPRTVAVPMTSPLESTTSSPTVCPGFKLVGTAAVPVAPVEHQGHQAGSEKSASSDARRLTLRGKAILLSPDPRFRDRTYFVFVRASTHASSIVESRDAKNPGTRWLCSVSEACRAFSLLEKSAVYAGSALGTDLSHHSR